MTTERDADKGWFRFGRRVDGDDAESASAEHVVKLCPAAVVVARLSDDSIVAESEIAQQLLRCAEPRIGDLLSKQWLTRRDFDLFKERFLQAGSLDGVEVMMQRNSGEQFWCAANARKVDLNGEEMIFLSMSDLTEQLAANAEIARQTDALHDAEKLSALGELLAGISHELNNPLSVLVGQALMLKEKAADEATARRAEKISKAADRCSRIVRSFLDLARQVPTDPVAIDLNGIVIDALDATGDGLRSAGVNVALELPDSIPRAMADPDQIRQVVVNLVTNAQQALEGVDAKRVVSIRTRYDKDKGEVLLKVSDTGPGVPPEISSRIFDPLFTTKGPGEGTGLGLALCRRIVETHGGRIELEKSSALGTTFVVAFPAVANMSDALVELWRSQKRDSGKLSVLIMDDDVEAGGKLAKIVSGDGHGVDAVESAFVGLKKLRDQKYDAVLCRAGLSNLNLHELLGSIENARAGMIDKVVCVVRKDVDSATLNYLDRVERPYLREPFKREDALDVLELLSLRSAN